MHQPEGEKPERPSSGFRGRVVAKGDSQVSNGNIANLITVARIAVASAAKLSFSESLF